ncbi:MAG: lytic transglycosylase domain-containing protein, partial [Paracoccaceae bacterium]
MPFVFKVIFLIFALNTSVSGECGGEFNQFIENIKKEAQEIGYTEKILNTFFENVSLNPQVLEADRAQGIFLKPFNEFAPRLINDYRMKHGKINLKKYSSTFDEIEKVFGVSRGILTSFWALETDFGAVQGNFNTRDALVTLAFDCRRPFLFRPQIFAALELFSRNEFNPSTTKGAWAGEIGMVQMLPKDILENGVDADGDGTINLQSSTSDALFSAAKMLKSLGWQANEPWLQEVTLTNDIDWLDTGTDKIKTVKEWKSLGITGKYTDLPDGSHNASLIIPQGRKGPKFLAYSNFNVFFEWNKSFIYVLTAAHFANRLEGSPAFSPGNPDKGLNKNQMKLLQTKLKNLGYEV